MIAPTLVAFALGYWGPNHAQMNYDVIEHGTPFKFSRNGLPITRLNDYFERVLYLNDGVDKTVDGVKFFETPNAFAPTASYKPPGTDKPTDPPNHQRTAAGWMIQAGIWEDGFNDADEATKWGGLRAVNHFHDPIAAEGGYTGIRTSTNIVPPVASRWQRPYIDLFRKGKSVTAWAMGGDATQYNHWGYPSAVDSFRKFFTETERLKRSAGLGNAMRALGQLMHLVEDNTVPDHARDLAHPGNGWEEYLKGNAELFRNTPKPWRVMPQKKIEEGGLRALWDRDVYTRGASPASTVTDPVGIDEFVQANFLAWNRFDPWWVQVFAPNAIAPLGGGIEFTTIPATTGVGFENYQWPQLAGEVNGQYPSASPALPLPCVAVPRVLFPSKIDAPCWKNYELPLMKIAHGYAQSVVTLAFPQGRAEMALAPAISSGDPVDPRKWRLRIWNLGGSEDGVTWHVDSAKIVGIAPEGSQGGRGSVPLDGVSGDIPPSVTAWESPTLTLTAAQQQVLNFTSHTIVVLEGNIGAGMKKTPFVFGFPIPNGLPLVMQETTHINPAYAGSIATTSTTACCQTGGGQCTPCGETSDVRQPFQQTVTGKISMMASEVDLLGEPATPNVKAIQSHDARIAGAALIAYPQVQQPYFAPTQPTTHTFTINDPRFACAASVCRRADDAPDLGDPRELTYSFTLNIKELFAGAMAPPLATESVYVMVWTTAGAIYEWPVLLWPAYHDRTADQLIADYGGECGGAESRGLPGAESAGGCTSNARQMTCMGSHSNYTRRIVMGPIIGLSTRLSDVAFFALPGLPRVLLFSGIPPTTTGPGALCNPPVASASSYDVTCVSDQNSFIVKQTLQSNLNGPCTGIPAMPTLNQTAKYEGTVKVEAQGEWKKLFGHKSYPKWITDLD